MIQVGPFPGAASFPQFRSHAAMGPASRPDTARSARAGSRRPLLLTALLAAGLQALQPAAALAAPAAAAASGSGGSVKPEAPYTTLSHPGPCNASTAQALGEGMYVMVDNQAGPAVPLRLYRAGVAGPVLGRGEIPAQAVDPVADAHPALDLEASTRIGPLVYWIGSHGAARGQGDQGEIRPNRRRLFATNLGLRAGGEGQPIAISVETVGRPYSTLIEDLAADPRYAGFGLAEAATRPDKAAGGLSIEGLAATPSGSLLIGFRNPTPGGKALLAPLTNPNAVLAGEKAAFGDPVLLDLGGLGVRSLERAGASLLIVAGPATDGKGSERPSALYRWSGQFESEPVRLRRFPPQNGVPLNPEALVVEGNGLSLLSDDGSLRINGKACQDLPADQQRFREMRITPLP